MRRDGRTATPSPTPADSSSHARRAPTDAQAALLMARELLRYRPVDDLYEDWLDRIAELVSAAGGSPASSLSLPHPPPAAGDVAHGAPPPPPPRQDIALGPRRTALWCDPPRRRPCVKKKAVRRSSGHKKMHQRSLHHHVKTALRVRWWRMSAKIRLHFHNGLR